MGRAATDVERALSQVARFCDSLGIDHSDNHRDAVFFETLESSELRDRDELAIDIQGVESLTLSPSRDVGVKSFSRFHHRREHFE